jgi:hopanoid C-3 methylase
VAKRFHAFLHLEPLDLEIVAGGIDLRHETQILDLTLSRRPFMEFADRLRQLEPDVIGFSGYSNQARNVKRLAEAARAQLPGARILAGGIHATIAPADYGDTPAIDLVVRGEGATALRALIPHLESGGRLWPESERFLPTASARFAELARLAPPPWPDYSEQPLPRRNLVDRTRYFCVWGGERGERVKTLFPQVATLRTSTGCPHRCNFCVVHFLAHGKYLQRDPEDVVREIAALGEDHIYFVDDEMFINAQRTETIARLLLERGIRKRYISWARSDTICRNVELFRLWKKAGLAVVYVGLESLEEKNLQDYHKGLGADTNRRAVEILRELGIELHAALMVNPDFTKEDFIKVQRSIDFVAPAEVSFTVFSPPPGTALWEKHRQSFICADPYAFYDCMHTLLPTRLPLNEFYRYFSLLYLFAFRQNPWRAKRIRAPWRDMLRMFRSGALSGYALRSIYRDYDRKLW